MTTLPPEENGEQQLGGQPTSDAAPAAPSAPTPPPAGAPQASQVPPQAPPQQPSYQAPPQAGYQQAPQAGYAQPAVNPVGNLQLNYWLSVFFSWLPALIFFLIDKDKGDRRVYQLDAANLNFSLLRTILYVAQVIFAFIPYLNIVLVPLCIIAHIVLFVFHIIAATKVQQAYQTGQADPFIFNLPMVK